MKNRGFGFALLPPSVLFLLIGSARSQEPPPPPPPQAGVEVLTHGPVHEAFAQATSTRPEQGPVITKAPPDPIEELPPDQKPEGDNVQWIPGYWAWDTDANDFLWVSGCWRDIPPSRRWVPGHWQEIEGGWTWVGGFWGEQDLDQVQYLPSPPPTLDLGPSAPGPDANSIYVPGCWIYQTNRYVWRPGFWNPYQPNWVWNPAYYIWTPSGYLFVDGYWDHPLDGRGLLFAPAFINREAFFAARQPFVPGYAVNTDFLLGALFVRPSTAHYYFGDYFGPEYTKRGFVPWPDYSPVRGAHDPSFAYYGRLHAADPKWETSLRGLYTGRSGGGIPRPPRTLSKQMEAIRTVTTNKTANAAVHNDIHLTHAENVSVVAPLNQVHNSRVTNLGSLSGGKGAVAARPLKLQAVPKAEREQAQKAATIIRQGGQVRHAAETQMLHEGKIPVQHTDPPRVMKLDLPKVPPHVVTPGRPVKVLPPPVVHPKVEERAIPKYEPARPPGPPRKGK